MVTTMKQEMRNEDHLTRLKGRKERKQRNQIWWVVLDLNQRPLACETLLLKGGGRLPPFWSELYPFPDSQVKLRDR